MKAKHEEDIKIVAITMNGAGAFLCKKLKFVGMLGVVGKIFSHKNTCFL